VQNIFVLAVITVPITQKMMFPSSFEETANSISKSIVSRRRAEDSAVARQGEGNNDTIDLEME
jgi:hypothetical protein